MAQIRIDKKVYSKMVFIVFQQTRNTLAAP